MPITWPISLPQNLLQGGYQEQAQDNTLRFEPDIGPNIVRRRFTAVPVEISGSIVVTPEQKAVLDDFHQHTLEGGALEFDWYMPVENTACTLRFRKPPAYSAVDGSFLLAGLSLEVLP